MDLYRCSTLLFTFVQTSIFCPFRVLTQGRASRETEQGFDMDVSLGRCSQQRLYLATLRMGGRCCSGCRQDEEGRVTSFLLLSRAGFCVSFLNYSSASSQKRHRRSGLRKGQMTGSCLISTLCSNASKKPLRCEGCGCVGVSCWEWELEVSWRVACVLRVLSASCFPPPCSALRESRSKIILVQFLSCITPINLNYYSPWQLRAISRGRRGKDYLITPYDNWISLQQWCIAGVKWLVQLFERMDLTDKQLIQWRQLGSALSAPPALCQQALSFYSQYRQFQSWGPEGMGAVWHAAYFLAEKAQVLFDGEGKRIRSVALSGNAILRDQTGHEDFLYHLRQMTRSVPLPKDSQQLEEEVGLFARQMSFSLTFLNKLRSTLRRIRVSQKGDSGVEYEEQVQRCLWLLFVDCRAQRALSGDILENTCLLSCVLAHFLHEKYRQEGVYSIYFHQDTEGHTLPNEHEELLAFVMEYFLIKDVNAHRRAYSAYQLYLQGLARIMDIRRFFSPQNITRNIHCLQRAYSKRITDQQLDQSSFLKGNSTILHPRVTPFARRGLMTNRNLPALSHRMLSFEVEQQNQSERSNQHQEEENMGMKVLQKLKNRPTPKTALIRATPMTEAMQMYNWLYDMRGRHSNPLLPQQTASMRHVLSLCSNEQISATTVELIGGLWMQSLQKCTQEPLPSLPLLLLSTHVALHVLNASQVDLSIPMSQLQVGELEVWEGLDWLLNFDRAMPVGLRLHLLSVETSFISSRLWGSAGLVEALGEEWAKGEGRHRLLKRVTHQAAMEIHFLCRRLGMSHMESAEDLSYRIFQQALKSPQKLLLERSIQQLVVCCIYAATKVLQLGSKFNQILGVCREVLGLSAASFQQLVDRVRVGDRKDSIILFYNMSFVPALKGFLRLLRDNQEQTNREGPHVRDMISSEAVLAKNQLSSPQMANYLAYSESPILRPRLKQINQNVRHQPHSQQYSLQDIEAKFGKPSNTASLKEARRTKH